MYIDNAIKFYYDCGSSHLNHFECAFRLLLNAYFQGRKAIAWSIWLNNNLKCYWRG